MRGWTDERLTLALNMVFGRFVRKKKKKARGVASEYDSVVVCYVLVCRTKSGRPAVQSFIWLGTLELLLSSSPLAPRPLSREVGRVF